MSEVALGVTLPQFTEDPAVFVEGARRAEEAGLDSVWLFDHLWPLSGGNHRPVLEAWTALAWVAAATARIHIGTLVTRSSLRHPAVLARMAATVCTVAPGRVTVGLGSGDSLSRDENEAFGIAYLEGPERVEQLSDCAEALLAAWSKPVVSLRRANVELDGLPVEPLPQPRPELWIGGRSSGVIEVAARLADRYNAWGGTPEDFAMLVDRLRGMAGPRDVPATWGGVALLDATDEAAIARLRGRHRGDLLVGSAATVASGLKGFVRAGARHLILSFPDAGRKDAYERLATEVRPLLEEQMSVR